MKELKYEKSKNKKNIVELKQFNNEIMNMEASLKEKNDKIFQL